jgi:5-methylcytosine-specific restriction enzyme A
MPTTCALCRRVISDERIADPQVVQEHHLRPENRAESPTVMLCRPCHKQVHALFTNDELRESYDTTDALRSAERLQGYVEWIRGTDKLDVQVTTSNRVRDRRG